MIFMGFNHGWFTESKFNLQPWRKSISKCQLRKEVWKTLNCQGTLLYYPLVDLLKNNNNLLGKNNLPRYLNKQVSNHSTVHPLDKLDCPHPPGDGLAYMCMSQWTGT